MNGLTAVVIKPQIVLNTFELADIAAPFVLRFRLSLLARLRDLCRRYDREVGDFR